MKVLVCRSLGDYLFDEVDADQIEGVHWDDESGGIHKTSGGHALYGYLPYAVVEELNVKCSGEHNWGNNGAKICIPASANKNEYKEGYQYLVKHAEEKPKSKISESRPEGWGPCTKTILSILSEEENFACERGELRKRIKNIGYEVKTFRGAIKSLLKQNKIMTEGNFSKTKKKIILRKNTK